MSSVSTSIGTAERVPLPDLVIRAAIHRLLLAHFDAHRDCSATPTAASGASAITA
jgi:hypothetical protein